MSMNYLLTKYCSSETAEIKRPQNTQTWR